MKVAILYICTGKYTVFWGKFYESFERNFLPASEKTYFVFSDKNNLPYFQNKNVCLISQKNLGWPDNTLLRFALFAREEARWKDYDYTFFINANFLCVEKITEEEFLPLRNQNLLVAEHASAHGRSPLDMTYERNPLSTAYVGPEEGSCYVMGGLNGGKTEAYMRMVHELKENVEIDKQKSIVALWHDESHLNRYIIGRNDVKILPPCYGYPEGWDLPYAPKMLIRDKSKYFDVEAVKAGNHWRRVTLYFGRLKSKIAIRVRIRHFIAWLLRKKTDV